MATQWGKLKKTLSFEGATPEAIAEAESNAKQLEYGKNAIKEQLYEKYGV